MTCLQLAAALLITSLVQPANNTPAPADGMAGSTVAGGYKIELLGTANVRNMDSVVVLRRNPAIPMFGNTNFELFGTGEGFNFSGGNVIGGANFGGANFGGANFGGGNAAAGDPNGNDGQNISPNFGVALRITPEAPNPNPKRKRRTTVALEPGSRAVEQDGEAVQSATGPTQLSFPEFEEQFPDSHYIYFERKQNPNRVLREISGELRIQPGRELKAVFPGADPRKLRVDGEEFQLQKVEQTAADLRITAAFPPTTLAKKARTIPERMQAMMQAAFSMQAFIEDSTGQLHEAKSGGTGGGSNAGFSSFSFNNIPQGRKTVLPPVQPTVMTFVFGPLEDGRTISNIILRMADIEGKPELVPFTITVEAVPD
jgi:hypothetical protein